MQRLKLNSYCPTSATTRLHQRKNPPRISADGFWAKQLTLTKTPRRTGPVKPSSN
jgi:hypothetical protein